jgi:hypothetical protein
MASVFMGLSRRFPDRRRCAGRRRGAGRRIDAEARARQGTRNDLTSAPKGANVEELGRTGTHHRKAGEVFKDGTCGLQGSFEYDGSKGRFPANLCHDGSQMVLDLFPETGKSTGGRWSVGIKSDGACCPCPKFADYFGRASSAPKTGPGMVPSDTLPR